MKAKFLLVVAASCFAFSPAISQKKKSHKVVQEKPMQNSSEVISTSTTDGGVIYCSDFHITKPARELAKEFPVKPYKPSREKIREMTDRDHRKPQKFIYSAEKDGPAYGNDPAIIQDKMGMNSASGGNRAPIQNWMGQNAGGAYRPYDPSGAAGSNYYVQAINSTTIKVYNKSNGSVATTFTLSSLWGTSVNDGDPIILYDRFADRWFLSQFGQTGNKMYIAISQTNDPTGSYYTYTFTSPQFPDYLKFSVWQDGYYMTSNQSTQKLFVFERDKMLVGNSAARSVYTSYTIQSGGGFTCPQPGDADGSTLPPAGTPCPIFHYTDNAWGGGAVDGIRVFQATTNWTPTTPTLSITGPTQLTTASFDASYNSSWNDVNQPGTTQMLDGIGGVIMYRVQYRRWSGYNTAVMSWAVKISTNQRAVMWAEVRQNQSTGTWSLYQQGIYAPDTYTRWLSGISMDDNGSIALAYAKVGKASAGAPSDLYMGLYYTGRYATDPLGQMTIAEETAITGTSYQSGVNRDGDYSHMTLDPDGQTFWMTSEYMGGSNGGNAARTRIYSFKLPLTNSPPVADFTADNTTPCVGSTVQFTDLSSGAPTSWAWSFSPSTVTYVGGTNSTSQNPQVQFNATGSYTVTLTATNAYGSDPEVKTAYIVVSSGGALPLVENFEGATFPPTGWSIENADAPSTTWGTAGAKGLERRAAAGNTGSTSGCAGLDCYYYSTDTTQADNLISPSVSLVGAVNPKMTFKRAYKYYNSATNPNNYHDELRVYVSTDCGTTWGSSVYYKKGVNLATNGTTNSAFTPSVAADWDTDTVDLSAYIGQNINVKFEFTSRYGQDLYIDDVNFNSSAPVVAAVSIAETSGSNPTCSGQSVTFTATPTNGGTAPTYQWQVNGVNAGSNSPTFTTSTLSNNDVVTCIMTSNLSGVTGSPATSNSITMTVNPTPSTPTASSNSPVCTGSSINLTTPAVSGATYSWTGPSSYTSASQNPTLTNATTAMAGTYSVTVTKNGCTSAAGTVTVTVNQTPATPSPTSNSPVCSGSTLNLNTTAVSGATYSWTGPSSYTSASQNPTRPNSTTAMSGTYSVTVTKSGCTSAAGTVTVTVNQTPNAPTAGSNSPVCEGQALNLTASTVSGTTYSWTGPGSYSSTTQNPTISSPTAASSGTYSVTATANGCTSTAGTVSVTVNPLPATPVITTNSPVCTGSTINLSVPTVSGATYNWTGPNGFTSTSQNPSVASASAANAGTYSVTVTVGSCTSAAGTTVVGVGAAVTPDVTVAITDGSNPTCAGQSMTFTATPTNGGTTPTYQWQVNGINVGTNSDTYTTNSLSSGDVVTVTMTSSAGCVTSATATSTSTTVTVNAVPSTPSITANGAVLTSSSATGNQWYLNGVLIPGATGQTYTATQDGDYTVVVTQNGCSSGASATSTVSGLGVNEIENPYSLTVYPNPNNGVFTISFNADGKSKYQLELYNDIGQVVFTVEIDNYSGVYNKPVDLGAYARGVYTISLTSKEAGAYKKVIVY